METTTSAIIQCNDGVRFTFPAIADANITKGFLIVILADRRVYNISVVNIKWIMN